MGFTLRAALAAATADARLAVAEIVPELAGWARGPMAPLFGDCLEDPRLTLRLGDVAAAIAEAPKAWDAILLDVDNGPQGLSRPANGALYAPAGLSAARAALRPGGVLALWSARPPEPGFTRRLERAGLTAQTVPVRAGRGGRGARHTVWLAQRPA